MVSKTTLAVPVHCLGNHISGLLFRTLDGRDIIAMHRMGEAVSEGQWGDGPVFEGLPAALLKPPRPLEAWTEETVPIHCREEWRNPWRRKGLTSQLWKDEKIIDLACSDAMGSDSYPSMSTVWRLWKNEEFSGERLLFAEERNGPENYLNIDPIVEKIPPGFYRSRGVLVKHD